MSKKGKKVIALNLFRDPNLSDRELMLLTMYKLIKLETDIKVIRELILRKSDGVDAKLLSKMTAKFSDDAFEEYAYDVHQFVNRKQNVQGN